MENQFRLLYFIKWNVFRIPHCILIMKFIQFDIQDTDSYSD